MQICDMLEPETIYEGLHNQHSHCHWQFNYNPIVHAILNVVTSDIISISVCCSHCKYASEFQFQIQSDLFNFVFFFFNRKNIGEFSLWFQGCDQRYHYQSCISRRFSFNSTNKRERLAISSPSLEIYQTKASTMHLCTLYTTTKYIRACVSFRRE